jgi:hypothetical protein
MSPEVPRHNQNKLTPELNINRGAKLRPVAELMAKSTPPKPFNEAPKTADKTLAQQMQYTGLTAQEIQEGSMLQKKYDKQNVDQTWKNVDRAVKKELKKHLDTSELVELSTLFKPKELEEAYKLQREHDIRNDMLRKRTEKKSAEQLEQNPQEEKNKSLAPKLQETEWNAQEAEQTELTLNNIPEEILNSIEEPKPSKTTSPAHPKAQEIKLEKPNLILDNIYSMPREIVRVIYKQGELVKPKTFEIPLKLTPPTETKAQEEKPQEEHDEIEELPVLPYINPNKRKPKESNTQFTDNKQNAKITSNETLELQPQKNDLNPKTPNNNTQQVGYVEKNKPEFTWNHYGWLKLEDDDNNPPLQDTTIPPLSNKEYDIYTSKAPTVTRIKA